MFYEPELARGWVVEAIYEDNPSVRATLALMEKSYPSSGQSDVGTRDLLYCYCINLRPKRVLELGTHMGFAAVVIAAALQRNGYGRLYSVEPHEPHRAIARRSLVEAGLGAHVELVDGLSTDHSVQEKLRALAPFDIIYIDADHSFEAAYQDIALCAELIGDNGIMILHDVGRTSTDVDPTGCGGPRKAVSAFAAAHQDYKLILLEHPLWLNPCGAALLCRQRPDPPLS